MDLDVFKDSGQFYTRGPGTAEPVRWIKDDGYWVSNREEIPESANKVSLEELPTELQYLRDGKLKPVRFESSTKEDCK